MCLECVRRCIYRIWGYFRYFTRVWYQSLECLKRLSLKSHKLVFCEKLYSRSRIYGSILPYLFRSIFLDYLFYKIEGVTYLHMYLVYLRCIRNYIFKFVRKNISKLFFFQNENLTHLHVYLMYLRYVRNTLECENNIFK